MNNFKSDKSYRLVVRVLLFLQEFSLYLFAFSLPSPIMSLVSVMLGVFLGSTIFLKVLTNEPGLWDKRRKVLLLMGLFFLLFASHGVYAKDQILFFRKLEVSLGMFLVPLAFVLHGSISFVKFRGVLFSYLLGVTCSVLIALVFGFWLTEKNYGDFLYYDHLASLFNIHTTYIGMMLVIALVLLVSEFNTNKYWWCLLVLFYVTLYLNASRSTMFMGVVLPLSVFLIQSKAVNTKWLVILGGGLLIVGLVSVLFLPSFIERWEVVDSINHNYQQYGEWGAKYSMWKSAFQVVLRGNVLLGNGVDYYSGLYEQYLLNGFLDGYTNRYNAHNQIIESLLSTGILGAVVYLSVLVISFIEFWKKNMQIGIVLIIMFFVIGFTESYLERLHGVMLFTFFISVFLLNEKERTGDD